MIEIGKIKGVEQIVLHVVDAPPLGIRPEIHGAHHDARLFAFHVRHAEKTLDFLLNPRPAEGLGARALTPVEIGLHAQHVGGKLIETLVRQTARKAGHERGRHVAFRHGLSRHVQHHGGQASFAEAGLFRAFGTVSRLFQNDVGNVLAGEHAEIDDVPCRDKARRQRMKPRERAVVRSGSGGGLAPA